MGLGMGKSSRAPPRTPLGGRLLFLLGRNGHDGEISPGPLLLAPDPFRLAHRMFDTTEPGQLQICTNVERISAQILQRFELPRRVLYPFGYRRDGRFYLCHPCFVRFRRRGLRLIWLGIH